MPKTKVENIEVEMPTLIERDGTFVDKDHERGKSTLEYLKNLEKELKDYYAPEDIESQLPTIEEFVPLEYEGLTDEEIAQRARELIGYDETQRGDIAEKYDSNILMTAKEKEEYAVKAKEQEEGLYELYTDMRRRLDNNAEKSGLGSSSIKEGSITRATEDYRNEKSAFQEAIKAQTLKYDMEIDALTKEKEVALGNYDISVAAKLAQKIQTLTKEREDKILETQNYNIKMAEKAVQFEKNREKAIADYYDSYYKEQRARVAAEELIGYTGYTKENYDKRFEALDAYYASLSDFGRKTFTRENKGEIKALLGRYYEEFAKKYDIE